SHQSLIEFYNRFFEKLFPVGYERMDVSSEANNDERFVEFMFNFDGDASLWRQKEASSVMKRISQLHDQGYEYKDISVICRSTSNMYMLENELRKRSIPYYSSSSSGFFGQQEIRDVTVFIKYLLNPSDKISEACVLRSLFLGASDDELLAYYRNQMSVDRIKEYLSFISEMRKEVLSLNPVAILELILERTCYDAALLALPEGVLRYANIQKLMSIFGRLQSLGRGIVEILEFIDTSFIEDSEPLAQAELEEEDSVKILTVHKAKGLEFPVVILMDLNHGPGGGNESVLARRSGRFLVRYEGSRSRLWETIDKLESGENLEEEKRSLYVAKTRAKELLIVSFAGQIKRDGKLKINESSFAGLFSSVFEITSNFDKESVNTLDLEIPVWKSDGFTISQGEDEEEWVKEVKVDAIVGRFSDVDRNGFVSEIVNEEKIIRKLGEKPSVLEIGTLMHRFLQIWDFREKSIRKTVRFVLNEGYVLNDSLEKTLIKMGEDFLNSNLLRRIFNADLYEREIPFYIEIDGIPERRKIDLLLKEGSHLSLFDYKYAKSKNLDEKDFDKYQKQLELYARAVGIRFGAPPMEKYLVFLPDIDLVRI
ncbi:MAG: hypothetical protein HY693_01670, partial [Deltaproteobacteria bacterium]|nr:hypothetical protein [Deltaproteobacteria bacterium]